MRYDEFERLGEAIAKRDAEIRRDERRKIASYLRAGVGDCDPSTNPAAKAFLDMAEVLER